MALTLDDLFASPDHFLHAFEGDEAVFVPMDRAAYRRSIFLDRRISQARSGAMRLPAAALRGHPGAHLRTAWIFHVAHCGSTLLARALDALGAPLVLREPLALRQAAVAGDAARLDLALRMAGKRYRVDGPTLVKANVPVNFVLADIAARDPSAPALLLHYGWRDYLMAILRSDNHCAWLHHVTGELAAHLGDLTTLTDGERAAALWLAQHRRFATALEVMPAARTLDAERFFAEPVAVLGEAAAALEIAVGEREIAAVVAGELFATYAKNPGVRFANADRVARRAEMEGALAPEIAAGERWLGQNAPDAGVISAAMAARALSA